MARSIENWVDYRVSRIIPSIPHGFLETVEQRGEKTAMEYIDPKSKKIMKISYNKYKKMAFQVAAGMMSLGIKPKSHVAILAETCYQWSITDIGIKSLGCGTITIFPTLEHEQIKFIFNDSDSIAIFVSTQENLDKVVRVIDDLPELKYIFVIEDVTIPSEYKDKIMQWSDLLVEGKNYLKEYPDVILDEIKKINEEDLASIIYTSGTTGIPKGVILSHRNILSDIVMGFVSLKPMFTTEHERSMAVLPFAHSLAHTCEHLANTMAGFTICFPEPGFMQDNEILVNNFGRYKPTTLITVPYMFGKVYKMVHKQMEEYPALLEKMFFHGVESCKKIVDSWQNGEKIPLLKRVRWWVFKNIECIPLKRKFGGKMKRFTSGGASLGSELAKFFKAVGIDVHEGFGLTETSPVVTGNLPQECSDVYPSVQFGKVGVLIGTNNIGTPNPYPPVQHKLGPNGEYLLKGPMVMKGYYKRPEETGAAIDKDGWLHTGDLAEIDENGYVKIIGRSKEIIVMRTGKKVAPNLVEPIYEEIEEISQVMLLGEGQSYIGALLVPDFEFKNRIINKTGIPEDISDDEFCTNQKVSDYFLERINETHEGRLSHFETVKKFMLVKEEFSEENGLLTPSLKMKRPKILSRYSSDIIKFYEKK
ncbi:MAG: long-chain fatty acid--CoA ligase [archaeon]|nr:long-chain fatty acid--CoA ligase [archaeon]